MGTRGLSRGGRIASVVVLAIGVLLLVIALLGAGSGGLSQEQLIAAGDKICARSNAEYLAIPQAEREVSLADTDRAAAAVRRANAPGFETSKALSRLIPAPEVANRYTKLLRLRAMRDQLATDVSEALRRGDAQAAGSAQQAALRLYDGPIREQAELVGFKVCGQPLPQ
jgi:hypothetical protein